MRETPVGSRSYRVEGHNERFRTKDEAEAFARLQKSLAPIRVHGNVLEPTHQLGWWENGEPRTSAGGRLPPASVGFSYCVIDLPNTLRGGSYQCWAIYMAPRFKTRSEVSLYIRHIFMSPDKWGWRHSKFINYENYVQYLESCIVHVEGEPPSQLVWQEGEEWYSGSKGLTPLEGAYNFTIESCDGAGRKEIRFERPSPLGWLGAFGVLAFLGAMLGRGQGINPLSQASSQEELDSEGGEESSRLNGEARHD